MVLCSCYGDGVSLFSMLEVLTSQNSAHPAEAGRREKAAYAERSGRTRCHYSVCLRLLYWAKTQAALEVHFKSQV